MRLTAAEIEAGRSPRGGWKAKQLAKWGVPWPPPKGWRKALLAGQPIPGVHQRFKAETTAYLANLSVKDRKEETHAILFQQSPLAMRLPVLIVTNYLDDQADVAAKIADILNQHWIDK